MQRHPVEEEASLASDSGQRLVRRAVELALFESKTSFEAFGIVPELK